MYSHNMVGSNDLARARKFYNATFTAIGGEPAIPDDKGRLLYGLKGSFFVVGPPIDGRPASIANGSTVGFSVDSPAQVDAWHKAGVENGGVSIEDPPGLRVNDMGSFYCAYLRDPDGHKLCATALVTG